MAIPSRKRKGKTLKQKSAAAQQKINTTERVQRAQAVNDADVVMDNDEHEPTRLWAVPAAFDDPMQIEIWNLAVRYFLWVEANPLMEMRPMVVDKQLVKVSYPKMRAMTIEGLCVFLGISRDTWNKWGRGIASPGGNGKTLTAEKASRITDVVSTVNAIIREQKFTGAASDLLNANLIRMELGIADKQESEVKKTTRRITTDMTPEEAQEAYAATLGQTDK